MVSLNVGTIRGKTEYLGYMAHWLKAAIIALQETRKNEDDYRLRLSGYKIIESLASKDRVSNGLARTKKKGRGVLSRAVMV